MKKQIRGLAVFPALLFSVMASTGAEERLPGPRFTDPERRAKLEKALPEIESIFERYWKQRGTPGLVYGVVIDGEVATIKAFGVRDRAANDPVTADTVFRIASMTKSFTALAILKLRDEGRLSLDDPIVRWIPEAVHLQPATKDSPPITVRDLLTHGAGLPEDNPWGDRQLAVEDSVLVEWLKKGLPFSTPTGTAYEYSNYGFALAGLVVQRASGEDYRQYLEKRVLQPLHMTASTLEPSAVPEAARATGYGRSGDGYFEEPSLAHGAFGAMGGLLTSAKDLGRYVAYQLSAFPARDGDETGPVRRSSLREMQRVWRTSSFSVSRSSPDAALRVLAGGYGYGLGISQDCRFAHMVGHGGGLPGFGSYMLWLPEHGVGMFAMANLTYSGPSAPIQEALDAFRKTGGLKPRELPPSPVVVAARDDIVRLWTKWDDEAADVLAADNLFLDTPKPERRKEMERIKSEVGECRAIGDVEPENLLRGRFRMNCERGFVDVTFTLAPTLPPRLQHLRFSRTKPMNEGMRSAAERLAGLVSSFSAEALAGFAADSLDATRLAADLTALRSDYGECRLGETLGGDGAGVATVRLECERGAVAAELRLDAQARMSGVSFRAPLEARCVP